MEKLNKDELEQRGKLAKELRERREAFATAIEEFNYKMFEEWWEVENAEADYNEAVAAARDWGEIHDPEYDYELEESNLEKPDDLVLKYIEYFSDQPDKENRV